MTSTDPIRMLMEHLLGVGTTEGNRIDILRNGDEMFPAMLEAIREATTSIDLLTFIYWDGQVAEAFTDSLAAAARRGVRVRLLVDGFGAKDMPARLQQELRGAGVEVEIFRPMWTWRLWRINARTHRRVLVCDEEVAFTGGAGISSEWSGDARNPAEWRDTHFRIRGPAVTGLRGAFFGAWLETERPFTDGHDAFPRHESVGTVCAQVVSASSQLGWNEMALAFRGLIGAARHRVRLSSAYFRPPHLFVDLLCDAAGRGVDVDVLLPGPHTDRRFAQLQGEHVYEPLLEAGVRIWRYQPTMLHTKLLTVDGHVAMVGTPNYDARSLVLNEQVAMILYDEALTAELDAQFAQDLDRSLRIRPEDWRARGSLTRMKQRLADVTGYAMRGAGAAKD